MRNAKLVYSLVAVSALSVAGIMAVDSGAGASTSGSPKPVGELSITVSAGGQPLAAPITSFMLIRGSGSSTTIAVQEATNTAVSAALAVSSATALDSASVTLDAKPGGGAYDTYRLDNPVAALSQMTTPTGPADQIVLASSNLSAPAPASGVPGPAKTAGVITIGSASAPFISLTVASPTTSGSSIPTPGPLTIVKPVDSAGVSSQLFTGLRANTTVKVAVNGAPGGTPLVTYTLTKVQESAYVLASSHVAPTETVTLVPSAESVVVTPGGAPPAVAAPAGALTLTLSSGSQVTAPIESAAVAGRSTSSTAPVIVNMKKLADGAGVTDALLQEDTQGGGISAAKVVIYTAPDTTMPLVTYSLQELMATSTESTTAKGLTEGVQLQATPPNFTTTYGSG